MVEFGFWAPVRTGTVRLAAYHKGSDYAAEGTDAHALCEYKLRRALGMEASVARLHDLDKKLEENAEQRKVLVGLMTKGYLEPAVFNKGNNELLQDAERIQRQKESLSRFISSDNVNLHEVSELMQYATKSEMLNDFDGELFTRFVERILVYSRTEIGFELKCGITLKERLVR